MVRALKKCLQILNMDVWGTPHDTSLNFLLVFEYSNTYNFKAEILPCGQNKKLEKIGEKSSSGSNCTSLDTVSSHSASRLGNSILTNLQK